MRLSAASFSASKRSLYASRSSPRYCPSGRNTSTWPISRVVIARLPFSVPEDPVEATLAEWIQKRGGNPFMQIAVPDAAIKLKQAVGRLLRTEADRGEVVILDRRLIEKRYGKQLLDSLPPFPLVRD